MCARWASSAEVGAIREKTSPGTRIVLMVAVSSSTVSGWSAKSGTLTAESFRGSSSVLAIPVSVPPSAFGSSGSSPSAKSSTPSHGVVPSSSEETLRSHGTMRRSRATCGRYRSNRPAVPGGG
ncbi:hypothetical protein [Nocardiopsis alba]|uniref:hypothetical protein n=1 Tax=Nocardiopsis alba TaxID=53437 RepID=UPI0005A00428|nr:hypothetical protein [Nocardiopsis alba]